MGCDVSKLVTNERLVEPVKSRLLVIVVLALYDRITQSEPRKHVTYQKMRDSLARTQQVCITDLFCYNRQKIVDKFRRGTCPREGRDTNEDPIWPASRMAWNQFQGERGELKAEHDEHDGNSVKGERMVQRRIIYEESSCFDRLTLCVL